MEIQQCLLVRVGKNAVVGGGSTVLPGCDIGEGGVLGAGSTLTKQLPKHEVWAGQPAAFLMTRKAYDEKQHRLKLATRTGDD